MGGMISFEGLASGLDTRAIIDALMNVERRPLRRLEQSQQDTHQKIDMIGQLRSKLGLVQSSTTLLGSYFTFNNKSAESSDTGIITAQARSSAQPGSFNITVNELAATGSRATQGVSSQDENIGTGSITIRMDPGGDSEDIVIDIDESNNTLEGLRNAINSSGAPVRAMIVNDGDTDSPFRLSITAIESGIANDFEVINDLEGGTELDFNDIAVAGQNASITLNGINIQRSSNTFDNVVAGITFDVHSTGNATISVSNDTEMVRDAINSLVTAYNELNEFVSENSVHGPLANDSTLRNIISSVRSSILFQVGGVSEAGHSFVNVGQIGIDIERDGSLSIDDTRLQNALNNNFTSVEALFRTMGTSDSNDLLYFSSTSETEAGQYEINITQTAQRAELSGLEEYLASPENEILTFTYRNGEEFDIELGADQSLSDIINTLNQYFSDNDIALTASNTNNSLSIFSDGHGSIEQFTVTSNLDAGQGTRIGTSVIELHGLDVEGTINGIAAEGRGSMLTALEGNPGEGLQVQANATGSFTMHFTRGISSNTNNFIQSYSGTGGLLTLQTRNYENYSKLLDRQIDQAQDRLDRREIELRMQYARVEQALGSLNATMSSINAQSQQFR